MKIAVTSANGQLGSAIINQLKSDMGSENVIGIARTPSKAEHLGVEVRKGDYNSREEFEAALKGVDVVVILSGNGNPADRIPQHRNIIEAAKASGVGKIVYTSITGDPSATAFAPVISSNRQTEEDIKASGLEWSIGRNGLYIEPDIEVIDDYIKEGKIANCAGDGLCGYTSRSELGEAYAHMATGAEHNGHTYNLLGPAISQKDLAGAINQVMGSNLVYQDMTVDEYVNERQEALGDFLGTIIGGIYEGIRRGDFEGPSHFEQVTGRAHSSLVEMIKSIHN